MRIAKNNPYLEELISVLNRTGTNTLQHTEKALENAAGYVQGAWKEIAKEMNRSGSYARSIQKKPVGAYGHEIFSEAKIAEIIENGAPELDMKKTHPYGPRSRISQKTGYPDLIVPFQWGTKDGTVRAGPKNIIPKQLLGLMLSANFNVSKVKKFHDERKKSPNARGEMVARNTYEWGGRVKSSDFTGTDEQKKLAEGMVRFEQGPAADRSGGKRYGGYFTFRVISAAPGAKGWIRKEQPAHHVTKLVARETRKNVNDMVEAGIREDFANL
jgi:hypothetical protein